MDYFEVFSLPRVLGIDLTALEKTFHGLSRKYHPDYFSTASPAEKTQAVRMTALLNDLQSLNKTIGLETMCVGGGQGMAMLVERLS